MEQLENDQASEAFGVCWQACGHHLIQQGQGAELVWLKANLNPPFLEHISFRLGNQLFFVRIEDVEGALTVPGSREGLFDVADGCAGHALLLPMRLKNGQWTPEVPGWGLVDAKTGEPVDPFSLVTEEKIEMTDWELQDFAVQVVKDHLKATLHCQDQDIAWRSDPRVEPAIWFFGDKGPEWVVVCAVRYPQNAAPVPENMADIARGLAHVSPTGHFAVVACASADESFDENVPPTPLWRGQGMIVSFQGLLAVTPKEGV